MIICGENVALLSVSRLVLMLGTRWYTQLQYVGKLSFKLCNVQTTFLQDLTDAAAERIKTRRKNERAHGRTHSRTDQFVLAFFFSSSAMRRLGTRKQLNADPRILFMHACMYVYILWHVRQTSYTKHLHNTSALLMGTAQQLNASALRAFLRYKTTHKQTGAIREQHSTADILSTVFFF